MKKSQQELADLVGVGSREAVSNWENGKVGDIDPTYRLGLSKTLGIEEIDLLLDPGEVQREFDMSLSREAKSIAYRWDDLPESVRVHLKSQIAETERLIRESPEHAKRIYPDLEDGQSTSRDPQPA